jgi:hypothetical protein
MVQLSLYLLPLFGAFVYSQGTQAYDYLSHARSSSDAMMQWYNQGTGVFNGTGWWNSAECMTALADMQGLDPKSNFLDTIQNTFEINKGIKNTSTPQSSSSTIWPKAGLPTARVESGGTRTIPMLIRSSMVRKLRVQVQLARLEVLTRQ